MAQEIMAHRGVSSLAPENTLPAFFLAARCGANWVETDVNPLGDGTLVLHHDYELGRCTSQKKGTLTDLKRDDLKTIEVGDAFDAVYKGVGIPTLQESIALFNRCGLNLNLEIKAYKETENLWEAMIVQVLKELEGFEHSLILSSFSDEILQRIRTLRPDIRIGYIVENIGDAEFRRAQELQCYSIHFNHKKITEVLFRESSKEFKLFGWTMNDKNVLSEKPFLQKADGYITDAPQLWLKTDKYHKK